MLGTIWSPSGQDFLINREPPFPLHLLQGAGHRFHIVKNCEIGHHLIVFDDFAQLVADILGDNAPVAEE